MDSLALPPPAPPSPSPLPDVVGVETSPRPTAPTAGPPFSEVLAGGARAFVRGATAAASALPGSPLMALALRGGAAPTVLATPSVSTSPEGPIAGGVSGLSLGSTSLGSVSPPGALGSSPLGSTPLGAALGGIGPTGLYPGVSGTGTNPSSTGAAADGSAAGTNDPSIASTLQQDEQMNLYYLQVQEQVNAQNRTYTTLSNVIEVENTTAKAAITNIHA